MTPGYRGRLTRLLAGLFSAGLLLATATPAIAIVDGGTADECAALIGQTEAGARGYKDASGMVREPVLAAGMKEVPSHARNRAGSAFSATVDVYWHVITNGTEGAVSSGALAQQMNVQNKAFAGAYGGANTGFKFKLASVDVTVNAAWFDAGPGSAAEAEMKLALKQGGPDDLNVYSTSGNAYLGWAYFPDIVGSEYEYLDGIVIDYRSLPGGPYVNYSAGGTLPHEAGHWAGLYHTFDGACRADGDLVADTPAERTPTTGCPEGKDTCPKPGLDPIHNYMDYSYDACYTEFTPGQATRMQDQFGFFRS
jgi:hypothetical protein